MTIDYLTRPRPLAPRQDILPVIIGGDFGVYGIGRCFNEAFGCRCICVGSQPTESITRSHFFDVRHVSAHATDAQLLDTLMMIAGEFPDKKLILMANHDIFSAFVARNMDKLSRHYALPFPNLEVMERLTDKAEFARACERAGIDTPGTVVVDFSGVLDEAWAAPEIPFRFPGGGQGGQRGALRRPRIRGQTQDLVHRHPRRARPAVGDPQSSGVP